MGENSYVTVLYLHLKRFKRATPREPLTNAQRFPLAFINGNLIPETPYFEFIFVEPIQRETIIVQAPTWTKYDYEHMPSKAFKSLPTDVIVHVSHLHEAPKKKQAEEVEKAASVQVEASTKVLDDTIVHGVIIDLTNTSIMDETPEASNAAIVDEVVHHIQELVSKQSKTSNEATLRDNGEPDVIIVYSSS